MLRVLLFFRAIAATCCLYVGALQAIEFKPWFGRDKEFEWRTLLGYQHYNRFQDGHHYVHLPSNTVFVGTSLGMSPTPLWSFEVEVMSAGTRQHDYLFDYGAITTRYLILDDVIGDPVSMTAGLTFKMPTKQSLRDISLFHCGEYEWEGHLSVGRETSCEQFWVSRIWATGFLGIANRGSPWTRIYIAWEKNWWNCQQLYLFADSLVGWGRRNVNLFNRFHGYGPIQHRSLDAGIGYSILTDNLGTVSLIYAYRIYAHDRPAGVHQLYLTIMMPAPILDLFSGLL